MPLAVAPLYAVPMVALFIALSARVIIYRRGNRIPLGDAGDRALLLRIRAQANCAEYMPFGLLLLMMAELSGAGLPGLHLAGLSLTIGRFVHALHLSYLPTRYTMRVVGIILTFSAYLLAIALALL
jgi:uncharacterized protein